MYAGCIKPLCDLLEVKDAKVVIVALEGLENILRAGDQQKTNDINDIATMIDEADGVNKIQALQYHANEGKLTLHLFRVGVIIFARVLTNYLWFFFIRHLHEVHEDCGIILQRRGGCGG